MKRVTLGVVGLRFGANLLRSEMARGPGAEWLQPVAVCDQDPRRLEAAAKEFGLPATAELDALLADPAIEAIGLFTGPFGRAGLLRRCLRAGKHVMTTKPFELDPEAAAAVLAEAASLGKVVHLNSPCASRSGDLRLIEEWRGRHGLGRPLAARCECWFKRVEKADGSWYDDPERCPVAPILRLGIYGINDMTRVLGEAESVQVMETRLLTGRPTPDLAQLTVRFKNGAIGHSVNGWCLQPSRGAEALTLYFENGTVFRNPPFLEQPKGKVLLAVVPAANADGRPAETALLDGRQMSMAYQWDVFARAVRGEPPAEATPAATIVEGVKVLAAMKRAMKSGRTEKV
jgi:predicted dehydrogenase